MTHQKLVKKFCTFFSQSLLIFLFLLLAGNNLFAQQRVTGTVKDGNSTPLESVSVTIKDKPDVGTTTDARGSFSISAWLFDGTDRGKNGQRYYASSGLALEAQAFPDAPNHSHFPPIVLTPEEIYHQETIYRFLIRSN